MSGVSYAISTLKVERNELEEGMENCPATSARYKCYEKQTKEINEAIKALEEYQKKKYGF